MEFLDQQRLGKQRVEAAQILEVLLNEPFLPKNLLSLVPFDYSNSQWRNHPVIQMWRGHEEWLKLYLACAIGEWCSRGYSNTIQIPLHNAGEQIPPPWLGKEEFHRSHRSNLVRKFPLHYRQFWPNEDATLPYYWPSDVSN
jgi:hypothetical protein